MYTINNYYVEHYTLEDPTTLVTSQSPCVVASTIASLHVDLDPSTIQNTCPSEDTLGIITVKYMSQWPLVDLHYSIFEVIYSQQ